MRTGSASSGQGHETAWAQLAADALGASPDDVRYVAGDTDEVAQGTGTFASRSAQVGGAAIWRTAHVVRRKAIELRRRRFGRFAGGPRTRRRELFDRRGAGDRDELVGGCGGCT